MSIWRDLFGFDLFDPVFLQQPYPLLSPAEFERLRMCNSHAPTGGLDDPTKPPTRIVLEGHVVYVRAVIAKCGDCGEMGITIRQPGCTATVVVTPKEIRREDRERLGIKESA